MEIRQIRYALAVARERSVTRAAARLGVSQSSVSEQLQLLERQLRFPLFDRTARGVAPTERGAGFLRDAERVLADLLDLEQTAQRLAAGGPDGFALGLGTGVASVVLPRLLAMPGLDRDAARLEVVTGPMRTLVHELEAERLDAAIAFDVEPERLPATIRRADLGATALGLIARPDYAAALGPDPLPLARLHDVPLVASCWASGHGIAGLADAPDVRPRIVARADDLEVIKAIVLAGGAMALVPPAAVECEIAQGLLMVRRTDPAIRVPRVLLRRRHTLPPDKERVADRMMALLTD